jgi:hypothetical protein
MLRASMLWPSIDIAETLGVTLSVLFADLEISTAKVPAVPRGKKTTEK